MPLDTKQPHTGARGVPDKETMMEHYAFSAAEINAATDAALECLAWSTPTHSEDGDDYRGMLDGIDAEFSGAARETMRGLLTDFMESDTVIRLFHLLALEGVPFSAEQIGHDFVLTVNGHGAGFWDRDYRTRPHAALDMLTQLCHGYANIGAYVSDAGEIELGY